MVSGVPTDHTCPVEWADRNGFLTGSPIDDRWCLLRQRDVIMALPELDPKHPNLLLWGEGPLNIYYAPWDWVNVEAKVMLVGITPGAHQAAEALAEARRCLDSGCSYEEALRSADAVGSFSGPMRANLVSMLDGIGISEALEIDSSARFFDTHHSLAANVSAIDYPVFVNDENYRGVGPRLTQHPVLRALVRACLGARTAMAPDALVVPLGTAATEAVAYLVDCDLLDPERCLVGFPHPSGANGWRRRQYAGRRAELAATVATWAQG